ncbi:DUF1569 domain-containing protein [Chitinophaga arvensicola]|uniref:DUF1569 domain-containing protein n=1 Tax=Chitinophaga arvensicola TaxID=29529 RepID=A0A1I0QB41_9BACT|nr:DUF1569 domain-containing protein [Chitinophaga arvensicola]SEW24261.1 Protein of unknown function [Chitinophaga arvensicola]
MALPDIFTEPVATAVIRRIEQLTPDSQPQWGKMNVAAMLAHCNVTYEMVYENIHPQPGFFMKMILKNFIKKAVTSETPYKRNIPTASSFLIKDQRKFDIEKERLIRYILKTSQLGAAHFNQKESHSFGKLTHEEWNNMFYKHLDHHLTQFGV